MNEQKIVSEMISFVEEKERSLQERKLLADQQAKNDTVKAILDELEDKIANENQ